MNIGLIEQLTHSTVRIETNLRGGGISTGTGFYMELLQKGDNVVPAIVTNKHVIANAQVGKIHVTLATADGMPDMGNANSTSKCNSRLKIRLLSEVRQKPPVAV